MPNPLLSQIVLPIDVSGTITNVTYDIKDAAARQMIADLGHALYWMGVTTTTITDGSTVNPIQINGESKTATIGAVVQFTNQQVEPVEALEFAFDGTHWQLLGHGDLGALAYADTASADYTPQGSVTVTPSQGADTTTSVTPFGSAGTVPSWSVSGEVATFNPGTAASAGSAVDVVTASGAITATAAFVGTQATITVEPDSLGGSDEYEP